MKSANRFANWTPLQLIALILVVLLIGPAPSQAQDPIHSPASPRAQALTCWTASPDHILPSPCGVNDTQLSGSVVNSIYAFEDQSLTEYLAANALSLDHAEFYATAGKALRDEVRAFLLTKLTAIIQKDADKRSAPESDVFNWVSAYLTDLEKKIYAAANAEYSKYKQSPCGYVIDAQVGAAFNVVYDTTNCYNFGTLFTPPQQPSAEYYLSVGTRTVYANLNADASVAETTTKLAPLEELYLSSALVGAIPIGLAITATFDSISPVTATTLEILAGAGEAGADAASGILGAAATGAGVFGIALAALLVLIQGTIDFANANTVIQGLTAFTATYQSTLAPGYQFDIHSAISDSQQSFKLLGVWGKLSSATTDLYPQGSSAPQTVKTTPGLLATYLFLAGQSYNLNFVASGTEQGTDHFSMVDWEGRTWSVTPYGASYFSKTCVSPSPKKDKNGTSFFPCKGPQIVRTLEGLYGAPGLLIEQNTMENRALISRTGSGKFMVRMFGHIGPDAIASDKNCAPNPATGISDNGWSPAVCSSFISDTAYFLTDSQYYTGNIDPMKVNYVRVHIPPPPSITSAPLAGFALGTASAFNLTAVNPTLPDIPINISAGVCPGDSFKLDDGLPQSISFVPGTVGTARISYNGAVPQPGDIVLNGPFNIHFCARQQLGTSFVSTTSALQISLGAGTKILSGAQPTIYWGVPFSQKIYSSGSPTPALTMNNRALNDIEGQLTFVDNHDGSATISGFFPYGYNLIANGVFPGQETSITADNGVFSDTKLFAITALPAPQPTVNLPGSQLTFVSGKFSSFTITTSGALVTPAFFGYPSSANPILSPPQVVVPNSAPTNPLPEASWMTFQDNRNGTATISGTPPNGAVADTTLKIVTNASYFIPVVSTVAISAHSDPYFTNPDTAIFAVGALGNFPLSVANFGHAGTFGSLPPGLSLISNAISGTPPEGSAGRYFTTLLATNGLGVGSQTITIHVTEPPTLYSTAPQPNNITVHAGIKTTISFSARGYPQAPPNPGSPAALGSGMSITPTNVTLPPAYYTYSDKDIAGKVYGGAVLTLTPPVDAQGFFTMTLTADNGIPNPNVMNLGIQIVKAGDVNHDGAVTCADISIIKASLGKRNGQPGYDVRADVNMDGVVDVKDLSFVASRLPAGSICP